MNQLKEHIEQSLKEFEEKFGMNIDWGITHSAGDYGLDAPGFEEITNFFRAQQLSLIEKIIAMVEWMEVETGLSPMARFGMDAISMDAFMTSRGYISQFDARREHNQALAALKSKLKELL